MGSLITMTPLGPAAFAILFGVYANWVGAYEGDDYQVSLHEGGCSYRCMQGLWRDRYPSIELGRDYPQNELAQQLDPRLINPMLRECLRVSVERRPWGHRPGRGGFMPGQQPGCKEDGTVAPIAGLSVEEFELRLRHGAPMIHGTRDMPELRSEAFNYSTFGTVRR